MPLPPAVCGGNQGGSLALRYWGRVMPNSLATTMRLSAFIRVASARSTMAHCIRSRLSMGAVTEFHVTGVLPAEGQFLSRQRPPRPARGRTGPGRSSTP